MRIWRAVRKRAPYFCRNSERFPRICADVQQADDAVSGWWGDAAGNSRVNKGRLVYIYRDFPLPLVGQMMSPMDDGVCLLVE